MVRDKRLYIMRGLPGSGKSTITAELAKIAEATKTSCVVVCCDDEFMVEGKYVFDRSKLKEAHEKCLIKAKQAMDSGVSMVVIDNTNVSYNEIYPYAQYAVAKDYVITFEEPEDEFSRHIPTLLVRNVHGVPPEVYDNMMARWEETDEIIERLSNELCCDVDYVTNSI